MKHCVWVAFLVALTGSAFAHEGDGLEALAPNLDPAA